MEKKLVQYSVVDAFTGTAFKGNPAAVCILEEEREEGWLEAVAREFNFSETCYLTRASGSELAGSADQRLSPRFRLRWFTPVEEVELCGHATLAAAHTLFTSGMVDSDTIEFMTLSGILTAKRVPETKSSDSSKIQDGCVPGIWIELDLPVVPITQDDAEPISSVSKVLNGTSIVEIKKTAHDDLFIVLPSGKEVEEFQPQFDEIKRCPGMGIIITGPAHPDSGFDFVSRFFYPKLGLNEDPVSGSAHCALAHYWSERLGKNDFVAYAASPRGAVVKVHLDEQNQRVMLRGKAVTVMRGSLLA
ncbi:uncharacterized isomerase BH0283-like [Rhodamnia argentea]|uniref:Uncharacterized isomerase BH0283-like n=1 Tax=Rhodamnia argentea TaxID=178133 RepID=A0ABM3HC58_9MYRT|nr:uncharacterized isomerase BH0283-like [Rhodamnia argentea]XP_048134199.1 uncharacterized isomerase BH0283-like [Rhodamnia argentea]